MNLSELLDTHRGARSYADLSRDCGGAPSAKRLQQIATSTIRNFPDPPTIEALAKGLRVSHGAVVLASAESLGLRVEQTTPRLFELLGASARDLTEREAGAVAHLVRTFVDSRTQDDSSNRSAEQSGEEIEPNVTDVLAERRRRSQAEPALDDEAARDVGREGASSKARRKQDAAGEPPADDPTDLEPR